MKYFVENNELVIELSGRVDTTNAPDIEKELNEIRAGQAHSGITLDFDDIEYVSSAGLRVILRLLKAEGNVKISNASSEVYEILEMTGFTEMMPVSKAYRKLSVDGCEVIGEGSNGIVYRYTDDIIIKVYKNSDALDDIHKERELARTAFVLGVNTAIPYDVVKVGDKFGSVFELLSAKSLTKLVKANPENLDEYVEIFNNMLKSIHETVVKPGTLPSMKENYLNYANFLKEHLDEAHGEKLYALIDAVDEEYNMIHGDYHTNNVHYANNEAILIDMDTLATGNPIFEFASIFNAYKGFDILGEGRVENFLKLDQEYCDQVYEGLLKAYFGADKVTEYNDKFMLLGYARLLRRTLRREPELTGPIEQMKSIICELLDRIDSLAI